jgi:threonine dehydrogenase-like Zn-dependent dehydrogenase
MMASDLPRAIEIVAAGSVDLGVLVTDRFALARAPEAFAALAERRGLKVIVKPNAV